MKRLQILIEEELDAALEQQAETEGTSKAALIRRYVGERLRPLPLLATDLLAQMAVADKFEPEPHDRAVHRTILDLEGSVQPKSLPEDFGGIRRQVAAARDRGRAETSNE